MRYSLGVESYSRLGVMGGCVGWRRCAPLLVWAGVDFGFCLGGVMCGARRRARARVGLMVATGCSAYLTIAHHDARPVRRLPDVEPYDDFRSSRWCHGGILQSSGRSEALPRHSHYLAVAPAPGSFLSVVRSGGRLRWQHPSGPSSGQGQTAIRRRPIGGPSGLARIVGNACQW